MSRVDPTDQIAVDHRTGSRENTLDNMAQAGLIDSPAATRTESATESTTSAIGQGLRRLARRCQHPTTEITEADDDCRHRSAVNARNERVRCHYHGDSVDHCWIES